MWESIAIESCFTRERHDSRRYSKLCDTGIRIEDIMFTIDSLAGRLSRKPLEPSPQVKFGIRPHVSQEAPHLLT